MDFVKSLSKYVSVAIVLLSGATNAAWATDADVDAFLTYAVLMEVRAANKGSKLTESTARLVAAAVGSIGSNHATALSACSPLDTSVERHGFVPPSFRLLPPLYARDYVRGTLVGATEAANAVLSDARKSAEMKASAIGEVVHLAQDIAVNQSGTEPSPLVAGDVAPNADRWIVQDDKLSDGALHALVETLAIARSLDRTGRLPAVAPMDSFANELFPVPSANVKASWIKALRDSGVLRYVEALKSVSESASTRNARGASIWAAAHSDQSSAFTPPDLGGADAVAYDAHPDWLLSTASRQSGEGARLVIDDLALAQQASAQLRENIARMQTSAPSIKNANQAARLKFVIDSSVKSAEQADAQLKQATAYRGAGGQSALVQAQRILARANKDTEEFAGEFGLASLDTTRSDCPAAANAALASPDPDQSRVARIATIITGGALASAGADLSTQVRATCESVTLDAIKSVFDRRTVTVPRECRGVLVAARDALENYARVHADTKDPAIERTLIDLVRK
jgi:hypothetical protein